MGSLSRPYTGPKRRNKAAWRSEPYRPSLGLKSSPRSRMRASANSRFPSSTARVSDTPVSNVVITRRLTTMRSSRRGVFLWRGFEITSVQGRNRGPRPAASAQGRGRERSERRESLAVAAGAEGAAAAPSAAPSSAQLRRLFVATAIPMVGFGFVDNSVVPRALLLVAEEGQEQAALALRRGGRASDDAWRADTRRAAPAGAARRQGGPSGCRRAGDRRGDAPCDRCCPARPRRGRAQRWPAARARAGCPGAAPWDDAVRKQR